MNVVGIPFILLGIFFVLYPRTAARWRNKGAQDPEPDRFLTATFRYVGGPLIAGIGVALLLK
jgi:hypothetical protein